MSTQHRRKLLDEFEGLECACGAPKVPKQTFCRACYYTLPVRLRRALYRRFLEGYEPAYDEAAAFLRSRGRIPEGESGLSADMKRRGYQ
jgi:hypothetical protein